jgi:hypothetical protein
MHRLILQCFMFWLQAIQKVVDEWTHPSALVVSKVVAMFVRRCNLDRSPERERTRERERKRVGEKERLK